MSDAAEPDTSKLSALANPASVKFKIVETPKAPKGPGMTQEEADAFMAMLIKPSREDDRD